MNNKERITCVSCFSADLNDVRFSAYRTAMKLRTLQKKLCCEFHLQFVCSCQSNAMGKMAVGCSVQESNNQDPTRPVKENNHVPLKKGRTSEQICSPFSKRRNNGFCTPLDLSRKTAVFPQKSEDWRTIWSRFVQSLLQLRKVVGELKLNHVASACTGKNAQV